MVTASRILGDQVGSTAPAFLAILAVHVLAGLTAVLTGAIAALARKGSPQHIRAGRWFYRAITVVFVTATALSAMRWRQDYYLFLIGAAAAPAIPGTSPGWASATPPCSPPSTSTTDPTCRYGTGCRSWRSGCSPPRSPRR